MSLQTRIFALFVIVLMPALAVQVLNEEEHRSRLELELRVDAEQDAVLIATELGRLVAGIEHTLVAISRMPAVRSHDADGCSRYVKDLKVAFNGPSEIGVSDLSGHVFCLSRPLQDINNADRPYFQRALATKRFSVGDFAIGRAQGARAIHFGYPVEDMNGNVNGVAFIPLNLSWLKEALSKLPLPPGSSVLIADRNGTLLAVAAEGEGSGHSLPKPLRDVLNAPKVSTLQLSGVGTSGDQVVGFVPLGQGPEGLFVAVSLSRDVGMAPAIAASKRAFVLLGLSVVLAFLLAWFISNRLVHRPMGRLSGTASRLRAGDLEARAELPRSTAPEFKTLGDTLNRLAESLQARENERARHERELRLARDEAQAASRSKTYFLAAVSHDLRQPLHSMSLTASLLNLRLKDVPEAAISARLQSSVSSLTGLLNAVLDVSQLDAGLIRPTIEAFPADSFLQGIAHDIEEEARSRGVTIVVESAALSVRSDPRLLRRIVENLATNAIKYSFTDGTVRLRAIESADEVRIEVSDDGPGIPVEKQAEVWEEFRQLGNPERNARKGLGLGLAIVRRMAALLDHEVVLRSDGRRGTTFEIRVPRAPSVARESARVATRPALTGDLLLVEDDAVAAESTAALLEAWGLRVVACESAESAQIHLARKPPFDILVTDYRLPGRSGLDLVHDVKASSPTPCVILSADVSGTSVLDVPDDVVVLSKPVDPDRLSSVLGSQLSSRRQS